MLMALLLAGSCAGVQNPLDGLPAGVASQFGTVEGMTTCSVSALPKAIAEALRKPRTDSEFALDMGPMADPEQEWSSGCQPAPGRPHRRLVYAGYSGSYWIIHYEQGGFVSSYVVVVLELAEHKARILWSGTCDRQMAGLGVDGQHPPVLRMECSGK